MLKPQDIREKSFDKTFGFGYRMDDVDGFLARIAADFAAALQENVDLEKKLEVLADKLTEYREDEESLRTALLGAQKLGDSVIRESKTKAEIIIRDANVKAETMLANAKRKIEQEQQNLADIQDEVANFKDRLLDLYKKHLELISELPEREEPEQEQTLQPADAAYMPPAAYPQEEAADMAEIARQQTLTDDAAQQQTAFALQPEEADDEQDEEDEFGLSGSTPKYEDMRFGEAYKVKRSKGQPKF